MEENPCAMAAWGPQGTRAGCDPSCCCSGTREPAQGPPKPLPRERSNISVQKAASWGNQPWGNLPGCHGSTDRCKNHSLSGELRINPALLRKGQPRSCVREEPLALTPRKPSASSRFIPFLQTARDRVPLLRGEPSRMQLPARRCRAAAQPAALWPSGKRQLSGLAVAQWGSWSCSHAAAVPAQRRCTQAPSPLRNAYRLPRFHPAALLGVS